MNEKKQAEWMSAYKCPHMSGGVEWMNETLWDWIRSEYIFHVNWQADDWARISANITTRIRMVLKRLGPIVSSKVETSIGAMEN